MTQKRHNTSNSNNTKFEQHKKKEKKKEKRAWIWPHQKMKELHRQVKSEMWIMNSRSRWWETGTVGGWGVKGEGGGGGEENENHHTSYSLHDNCAIVNPSVKITKNQTNKHTNGLLQTLPVTRNKQTNVWMNKYTLNWKKIHTNVSVSDSV